MRSSAGALRRSQCSIRSPNSCAAPADAAFEKGEIQLREAPRDAAEEDALGDRVAGGGEMADMVVDEVGRRLLRSPWLLLALEWKVGAMPNSTHFAQTGS